MKVFCWPTPLALFILLVIHGSVLAEEDDEYLNEWVVKIIGGIRHAMDVADLHGYQVVRELPSFPNHYILKRSDTPHRSKRGAHHHTRRLENDLRVASADQQRSVQRDKRDGFDHRKLARNIAARGGQMNDPSATLQWYLGSETNARRSGGQPVNLNVVCAWEKGWTGKGVSTTIVDDGIEWNNPDLQENYDPYASYDYNDDDPDPFPRYDPTNENKHGTRCAGEVAMVANNNICGVGAAFDSRIGGIRILDGKVTDRIESEALSFNLSHVDIVSASWGPTDNGATLDGPGKMAKAALIKGVTEGRNGKGTLYAWASGNGGRKGDFCGADGYCSSIYTISISSASEFGGKPWYAEDCASTLVTASSSGTMGERSVVSTDLHNSCTDQHSGTSAAAPLGAALFALLLEANPDLTWRDVQHILVHTSRKDPLADQGWYTNAAGYCVNLSFGFGLMDACGMVELADRNTWTNVGEQRICKVQADSTSGLSQEISSGNFLEVDFTTDGCEGQENEVNFLEHVTVDLHLSYPVRGHISAELESPSGTITQILLNRHSDLSRDGFKDFPLMSVHTWGERPEGTWKFRVSAKEEGNHTGTLNNAKLTLYGTTEEPEYRKKYPVTCGQIKQDTTSANDIQTEGVSDIPEEEDHVEDTMSKVEALLNSEKRPLVKTQLQKLLNSREEGAIGKVLRQLGLA